MKIINKEIKYTFSSNIMYVVALLLILFFSKNAESAQKYANKISFDSSKVELRKISPQKIINFRNHKDFNYDRHFKKPESIFGKIYQWIFTQFIKLFNNSTESTIIRWILIIAMVVFVILKLTNTKIKSLFYRNQKISAPIEFEDVEENIEEMNFDSMIQGAINEGNYRRAIRYHYLKSLKILTTKSYILWKLDKTNYDYYNELKGQVFQSYFKKISLIYESIWYGNFEVNKIIFENAKNNFEEFYKSIN